MSGALRHRVALLQFPFLAGAGMAGFLLPQAIGIVRNPSLVPESGLNKALLMCSLCCAAVYFGWRQPAPRRWLSRPPHPAPLRSVFWLGVLLTGVGMFGYWKLTSLTGGVAEYYSTRGNYALSWAGLPVVYYFISTYMLAGSALCGFSALALKSKLRLLPVCTVALIQLAAIVFLGRRSVAIELLVALACLAFFGKGWFPPRTVLLILAPVLALAMFVAPEYRTHSQLGGDSERIKDIDPARTLGTVLEGSQGEFWSLCYLVQVTDDRALHQFGAGLYNTFVAYFVPKILVGEDVKRGLFLHVESPESTANDFGWDMPYGMVATGAGTAYVQFWFPGCLCFYALARFMRYLWARATVNRDIFAQVGYALFATPAIGCLTNDMYGIYGPLFMFWLPLLAVQKLDLLSAARNVPRTLTAGGVRTLQHPSPLRRNQFAVHDP